jgi:hypothetical protein
MLTKILTNPVLLAIFGLLVLVAVARLVIFFIRKPVPESALPYASAGTLLSPAERSFLGVAQSGLGTDLVITPKVRLADVVAVCSGLSRSRYQQAFNRIAAKHVDFILCRASDYSILAVIELDDRSHQRQSRSVRDEFVDQTLAAAGIPILHVKAQSGYDPRTLAAQISAIIAPQSA